MNDETEALARGQLDGGLDEAGRRRLEEALERDPQALAEYVDQLQVHHRLGVALREEPGALPGSVVRELGLMGDSSRFSQAVVGRLKGRARGRLWEVAAAALVLGALGWFLVARDAGVTPAARPAPRGALFVVGHLPLEPGDAAVRDRQERLAGTVLVRAAAEVDAADAEGKALVAVSSTSLAREVAGVPGRLARAFRDAPVPLVTWEPRLYHDLGFIPTQVHQVDWAAARGQSHLVIADPAHPLAAGLSGRVQATGAPSQYSWGRVRADAVKVAVLENFPDRAVIFGLERGGGMPARRAGLFLFDATATTLTEPGWSLFDAAVRWCIADAR